MNYFNVWVWYALALLVIKGNEAQEILEEELGGQSFLSMENTLVSSLPSISYSSPYSGDSSQLSRVNEANTRKNWPSTYESSMHAYRNGPNTYRNVPNTYRIKRNTYKNGSYTYGNAPRQYYVRNSYQDGYYPGSYNGSLKPPYSGFSSAQICCSDCRTGDISCLSTCIKVGCNSIATCAAAGDGAYAAFCQRRCGALLGMTVRSLPDPACRGQCASEVQRLCRARSCEDYDCNAPDCAELAPAECD